MIEALMEARLISPKEFKIYQLFTSPLGQECFNDMKEELFWEEPDEPMMTEAILGFYDGRRSILRGIKSTIEKVLHLIHERQLEVKVND
jgi:hypothetical protein